MAAPRILSLGAGVQSSVLLLMSARGELPPLDAAVFADTRWEPRAVYEHLDWLEEEAGVPLVRTDNGRSLKQDTIDGVNNAGRKGYAMVPLYTAPEHIGGAMKLYPKGPIEQWLGISWDEAHRMRDPDVKYTSRSLTPVERRFNRPRPHARSGAYSRSARCEGRAAPGGWRSAGDGEGSPEAANRGEAQTSASSAAPSGSSRSVSSSTHSSCSSPLSNS